MRQERFVMKVSRLSIAVGAVALSAAGCMVGPNYRAPATTMPVDFAAEIPATQPTTLPAVTAAPVDITRWWASLNDPELNSLVERAIVSNPDLQIALMRLQQARAEEAAVSGGSLPALELDAAAGRGTGTNSVKGRIPGPLNAGTNTTGYKEITEVAGFDALWEVDLFGGIRREMEAATYDRQAAMEERNAVLITLISDVARAYLQDRAAEMELSIAGAQVADEQQSENLVQARFNQGFTNELDAALAKRELAAMQAEVAPLQANILQYRRRLAVLLGGFPEDLDAELQQAGPMPQLPGTIEPGMPVELLRRRPDIRQAERELAAATARIGVATDALYPHVILTGGAGLQGQGLGRKPLKAQFDGSIGPEFYWPILDFGTLDALVERQDYRTREVLLNYRRTVLAAVEEVNNAVTNYSAQQQRLASLNDALAAAQRAVQVATQRYKDGFTNFLDVLDAQRELYALQDQYATAQEEVVLQYISLYKALGGGWENYQRVPAIRQPQPAIIAAFHTDTEYKDGGK